MLVALAGPTALAQNYHTLKIENDSAYKIHEVYVSPQGSPFWGSDRLGSDILAPDYLLNVFNLANGNYDVKLVDEDGDQCIRQIAVYANRSWDITTAGLLGCEFR
jgi:hypothetical protein